MHKRGMRREPELSVYKLILSGPPPLLLRAFSRLPWFFYDYMNLARTILDYIVHVATE